MKFACSIYRAILDTGESYSRMYTLCIGGAGGKGSHAEGHTISDHYHCHNGGMTMMTLGRGGLWRGLGSLPVMRQQRKGLQEKVVVDKDGLEENAVWDENFLVWLTMMVVLAVILLLMIMLMVMMTIPRRPQGGSSGWRDICIPSFSATSAKSHGNSYHDANSCWWGTTSTNLQ